MRGDLGEGLVKGVVEAGVVFRLRENRLCRSHEGQSLQDVQRRKMGHGAEFVRIFGIAVMSWWGEGAGPPCDTMPTAMGID